MVADWRSVRVQREREGRATSTAGNGKRLCCSASTLDTRLRLFSVFRFRFCPISVAPLPPPPAPPVACPPLRSLLGVLHASPGSRHFGLPAGGGSGALPVFLYRVQNTQPLLKARPPPPSRSRCRRGPADWLHAGGACCVLEVLPVACGLALFFFFFFLFSLSSFFFILFSFFLLFFPFISFLVFSFSFPPF